MFKKSKKFLSSFAKEFKTFATRGNVIDLAIGIILGGSFGKIVSSLVNDIIMPPIGMLLHGVDFNDLHLTLKKAVGDTPAVTINYGTFINHLIDFTIIAISIFLMIKAINRLVKKKKEKAPPTKECPECFMSIPEKAIRCGHCTSPIP